MEPGNGGPNQPKTLGQTWRIQRPGPSQPAGGELPKLPDWPPLPEEKPTDQWPSLGSWPPASATERDSTAFTAPTDGPAPGSRAGGRGQFPAALGRLRAAPRRAALVLGLGAVVLLITALSVALAARAPRGINPGSGGLPSSSQTSQTADATSSATVTPQATTGTPASTQPPALSVTFTCASGQLHGTGKVCVQTQPGASLRLTVRYCNGSQAKGLHGTVTADADGNYTWTWPIRSACVGTATATVTAQWEGQTVTGSETFTVSA